MQLRYRPRTSPSYPSIFRLHERRQAGNQRVHCFPPRRGMLEFHERMRAFLDDKYLTKNNFIFFSEVLEHVFHVVNQMRPAFIRIELYPFVFDKAPQYFYAIQFWRIFWKIKDV